MKYQLVWKFISPVAFSMLEVEPMTRISRVLSFTLSVFVVGSCFSFSNIALADPCGIIFPLSSGGDVPIARTGLQQTYVFYRDCLETLVIRPSFRGKTDEFGMLIPFPSVPAIRKVPDNIFAHLDAAIDPPVIEYVFPTPSRTSSSRGGAGCAKPARKMSEEKPALEFETVHVVKEEAVGMYEVAVLQAGSAKALQRWMDDHQYIYPIE